MKITKSQLKRIIKEELGQVLREQGDPNLVYDEELGIFTPVTRAGMEAVLAGEDPSQAMAAAEPRRSRRRSRAPYTGDERQAMRDLMAREDFQAFAAERHPDDSLRTVARRSVRSRRDPTGRYADLAAEYGFEPSEELGPPMVMPTMDLGLTPEESLRTKYPAEPVVAPTPTPELAAPEHLDLTLGGPQAGPLSTTPSYFDWSKDPEWSVARETPKRGKGPDTGVPIKEFVSREVDRFLRGYN